MRALIAGAGAVALTAALTMPAQAADRTVEYRGYQLNVPAGWPVVDLDTDPTACVRFDRNAVYLGKPGAEQRCDVTTGDVRDAVLVEPVETAAPTGARQVDVPSALVRVTVSGDPGILGTGKVKGRPAEQRAVHQPRVPGLRTVQPGVYTGQGFDACAAPSQAAMDAWLGSPFRGVGVYIGGIHRACAQPNLTADWVRTQSGKGWHLIPTYVGLQAPCTSYRHKLSLDQAVARTEGRAAADDAVRTAGALAMEPGTVIYNDMEAYNTADAACSAGVLSFLSGWTVRLREHGYRSGVYSSAGSGIVDLVRNQGNGAYTSPDHVWFAWWNDLADADGGRYLPADRWPQRRIHQFRGPHDESYNGVGINIDSNFFDVRG